MSSSAKRILLLTTTSRDLDSFASATEKLSLAPVIGAPAGLRLPPLLRDEALELDFTTRDSVLRIVDAAQHDPFAAIIAIDEPPTTIAARAASMMGLACHPPKAADACADPSSLRGKLESAAIPYTADTAHAVSYSALITGGRLRKLVSAVHDAVPAAAYLFSRAVTALDLRHGPLHAGIAFAPAPAITAISIAAAQDWTSSLKFAIPLVDDDVSWPEAVIRNALALDIGRLYLAP
jgi:hypothetical protein